MIARTIEVTAEFTPNIISVEASMIGRTIEADADIITKVEHYHSQYPDYEGETTFTPSAEMQTIPTAHTVLLSNITINPIPSNYGLITWNGTTLTVS